MSTATKYRMCQLVFGGGFLGVIFCLSHLHPFETPHHNKLWFTVLAIIFVITLPFALGFYYYRAKLRDNETGLLETETLARSAERHTDSNVPKEPRI